jgi:hypothetical protein
VLFAIGTFDATTAVEDASTREESMGRLVERGNEAVAFSGGTRSKGRAILGVYRQVGEVGQLLSILRYSGFDPRELSLLFFDGRGEELGGESRDDRLRAGLLVDGARSLAVEAGDVFAAGPLLAKLSNGGLRGWTSHEVLRALHEILSAWGIEATRVATYETSVASGRCLVVLHVVAEDVRCALALMRRSSAEHVTLVEPERNETTPQNRPLEAKGRQL